MNIAAGRSSLVSRTALALASTCLVALVACGAPPDGDASTGSAASAQISCNPVEQCCAAGPSLKLTHSNACFDFLLDAGCTSTAVVLEPMGSGEAWYGVLCPNAPYPLRFPTPNPCGGKWDAQTIGATYCDPPAWNQITVAFDPNCPGCKLY